MKGGFFEHASGKKTKVKSVLFDLDGVLLDSQKSWWKSFNSTLEKFGSGKISYSEYRKRYSDYGSVRKIIEIMRKDFKNPGLGEEAAEYCNEAFSNFSSEAKLFSGAKKVVEDFGKRFRIALVSNTRRTDVFRILKKLEIENNFVVVITGNDVSKPKPDPEMILKACKILKSKPRNSVLVGDTGADIEAGSAAGCIVIGVGIEGDKKIKRISELPEAFDFIPGRMARVRRVFSRKGA